MRKLIFCFGLIAGMISCNNSQVTTTTAYTPQQFDVLYQGEYGGSGMDKLEILKDENSFSKAWNSTVDAYAEKSTQPKIDFSNKMVLAKHLEAQNSGGTQYEVQSVKRNGNKFEVIYKASNSSDFATQAITSPFLVVSVDKVDDPVVEFKTQD